MSDENENTPEEPAAGPTFEILTNDKGQVMIAVDVFSKPPGPEPFLAIRDDNSVIYGHSDSIFMNMPGIPEDVLEIMRAQDEVLIGEMDGEDVVRECVVPVLQNPPDEEAVPEDNS